MKFRQNLTPGIYSVLLVLSTSLFLVVLQSWPAQAACIKVIGKEVCIEDLDPTKAIPGSAEVAERLWGEAGAVGYPAAAQVMQNRELAIGNQLSTRERQFLRSRYGNLVDQVSVFYDKKMMDEWCGFGKCTSTDSAAQTYCNRIYVRDSLKRDDAAQLMLLAHEMKHVEQCKQLGGEGGFGFHYFREYKRANLDYANNIMEVDARNSARDFARNVFCPQVGCDRRSEYYSNYEGWGIDLPVSTIPVPDSGSSTYQNSCNNISISGNLLSANCRRNNGQFAQSSVVLKGIENINGVLTVTSSDREANYHLSCDNITISRNTLGAICKTADQRPNRTSLPLNGIENIDGILKYTGNP
jgi:CVNH domain/Domain of unknown function (DUF4157)